MHADVGDEDEEEEEDKFEDDPDGYHLEHRSELQQFSQSKEVKELESGFEVRVKEHKEVQMEEKSSKDTSRMATYDDIIALLDAEFQGFEEIPISREVVVEDTSRLEGMREFVVDGQRKMETTVKDEHKKERTLEGPEWKHDVSAEASTTVIKPPFRKLEHVGGPSGVQRQAQQLQMRCTDKEMETESDEEKLHADQNVWILKKDIDAGMLGGNLYDTQEHTGSLHRIRHKRHVIEEVVVEDVDTFYEEQPKKKKVPTATLR